MTPYEGIPVEEFIRKSDFIRAPKVTVIRGVDAKQYPDQNWAADEILGVLREEFKELQISDIQLSRYKILGNVSNDPDSKYFVPEDQLPLVAESLADCDLAILAVHERCGLPDSNTCRLIERLGERVHERRAVGDALQQPIDSYMLFNRTPLIVVACGGYGVYNAALTLSGALNKFGMMTVRHGLVFHDKKRGNIKSDEPFSLSLSFAAREAAITCKKLKKEHQ
jgi:hypothetical protein